MNDKLTPRQNEIISEALAQITVNMSGYETAPERIKTLRCVLVDEFKAVTAETDCSPFPSNIPSTSG